MPTPSEKQRRWLLYSVIAIAVLARLAYAYANPVFNAPDEQAHFKYVEYLVENGSFPRAVNKVGASTNDWEYYQPPLYYLSAAPFLLVSGSFHAVRFWSVVLAIGVVILTHATFRSLIATSFVAFLPSFIGLSASVTNDNLLVFLFTLFFFLVLRGYRNAIGLGVLLGCLALTKYPGLVALPFLAGVLWYEKAPKTLLIAAAICVCMFFPWLLRNQHLYGSWLAMELGNEAVNAPLSPQYAVFVVRHVFRTFWMAFGVYNQQSFGGKLWLVASLPLTLLLVKGIVQTSFERFYPFKLLSGISVVFLLLTLQFGFKYGQPQGRFMYPVLAPLGLFLQRGFRKRRAAASSANAPSLTG